MLTVHLLVALGGITNFSPGAPLLYSPLHRCHTDWQGHSSSRSLGSRSLVSGEEEALHICFRDEGSSTHLECLPSKDFWRVGHFPKATALVDFGNIFY